DFPAKPPVVETIRPPAARQARLGPYSRGPEPWLSADVIEIARQVHERVRAGNPIHDRARTWIPARRDSSPSIDCGGIQPLNAIYGTEVPPKKDPIAIRPDGPDQVVRRGVPSGRQR